MSALLLCTVCLSLCLCAIIVGKPKKFYLRLALAWRFGFSLGPLLLFLDFPRTWPWSRPTKPRFRRGCCNQFPSTCCWIPRFWLSFRGTQTGSITANYQFDYYFLFLDGPFLVQLLQDLRGSWVEDVDVLKFLFIIVTRSGVRSLYDFHVFGGNRQRIQINYIF